ncbi:MAG: ATP-binding protein [Acidobacteria bacterium]|nr:ATP-binding protein [Acidobacteriota bacterium]
MKPGWIGQELRATNPWWRRPTGWETDDPLLREVADVPFLYEPQPLADLAPGGLYVLRGPRRVGKSVELKRLVAQLIAAGVAPGRIIHAAVDGWQDRDLRRLVEEGREVLTATATGHRFWLVDKITGVNGDWPIHIKWLRDNHPGFRSDTVVLTGSSARDLDAATKALAGRRGRVRAPDRTLLPMGFGAFCRAIRLEIPNAPSSPLRIRDLRSRVGAAAVQALQPWLNDLVSAWERYLLVGGYPQAVTDHLTGADPEPFARDIWSVVHGDALRRADFTPARTGAFLARVAAGLGNPLAASAVARDLGMARGTVVARLEDLAAAYLAWPCPQEHGLEPRPNAQAKRTRSWPAWGPSEAVALSQISRCSPSSSSGSRSPARSSADPPASGRTSTRCSITGRGRGGRSTLSAPPSAGWRSSVSTWTARRVVTARRCGRPHGGGSSRRELRSI